MSSASSSTARGRWPGIGTEGPKALVLEHDLRRPAALGIVAALAIANVALGVVLASGRAEGVALAVLPVTLIAIGSLIASNRAILIFAAIAMNLLSPLPLTDSLPLRGGIQIYPSDILVLLAIAAWVAAWLVNPEEDRPSFLGTSLLRWPLLLFAVTLVPAIIRGHDRYGEKLVSVPLRLLVYAGIAAAVTELKPRDAYRWLVGVFYAGTVWQTGVAIYGYATGTSATNAVDLSTGGERVLAGSTAMFMAAALLLALLNLELDRPAGRTALHLVMAVLATFALVSTFQRTTFAAVGLLIPLFFLAFRRIGLRTAAFLPLFAPILVLAALLIPKADPTLFPTFANRISAKPSTDTSVEWRQKAISAVWTQVRESPLTGVGFGRTASFEIEGARTTITQDPHDQFIYLWAGGGLVLLASFVLLLLVYLIESWRRFRGGTREERRLIFWAVSVWLVFVVNSATGITLTSPSLLLTFWVLMVLPMIVRRQERTRT
jgi:O-antigen ligase